VLPVSGSRRGIEENYVTLSIDLTDRIALVTGGSRGIGRAIIEVLRASGAVAVIGDIDLAQVPHEVSDGLAFHMDVTDQASVAAAMEAVFQNVGEPEILVNNAGAASRVHGNPFTNQCLADWERAARVNTFGTVSVSAEWVRRRSSQKLGVIVNVASVAGRRPTTNDPAYSAAKAATLAFTQSAARDMAPFVRVVAVCPGMLLTPFYQEQYRLSAEEDPAVARLEPEDFFRQKALDLIPMGRGQDPLDIAHAVAFLASDLARNITGQALNVDGGLVMS
jgi:2-hydroxycyclohexanecarboxyl-CoA dehydrogenase